MVDRTRKGKILYCKLCKIPTKHFYESDKREKIVWWQCSICGHWRVFNNWS